MSTHPFSPKKGPILVRAEATGPNGSTNLNLLLDTGATTSLIDLAILISLGFDPDQPLRRHPVDDWEHRSDCAGLCTHAVQRLRPAPFPLLSGRSHIAAQFRCRRTTRLGFPAGPNPDNRLPVRPNCPLMITEGSSLGRKTCDKRPVVWGAEARDPGAHMTSNRAGRCRRFLGNSDHISVFPSLEAHRNRSRPLSFRVDTESARLV